MNLYIWKELLEDVPDDSIYPRFVSHGAVVAAPSLQEAKNELFKGFDHPPSETNPVIIEVDKSYIRPRVIHWID